MARHGRAGRGEDKARGPHPSGCGPFFQDCFLSCTWPEMVSPTPPEFGMKCARRYEASLFTFSARAVDAKPAGGVGIVADEASTRLRSGEASKVKLPVGASTPDHSKSHDELAKSATFTHAVTHSLDISTKGEPSMACQTSCATGGLDIVESYHRTPRADK